MKRVVTFIIIILSLSYGEVFAQDYGARLGVRYGGEVSFEPRGAGVLFGALDPAVKKWYVPQYLFNEYQWKQWEYTNYARNLYERYVDTALEGNYFYDLFGRLITKGWVVYDWNQTSPRPFGSSLFTSEKFGKWFNAVIISSDSRGQYHYALTAGSRVRTTLTPMTFSKSNFNGIQWDFLSDKYAATVLASRVSAPLSQETAPSTFTDNTNLFGGRATAQVGDFVTVGATFVNTHMTQTLGQAFKGNPFRGRLTTDQNGQNISRIEVHLSDDSPEDGEGGAAFFSENIVITYLEEGIDLQGRRVLRKKQRTGEELGFRAIRQGGRAQEGYFSADGNEKVVLIYDFNNPVYRNIIGAPAPASIIGVTVELVVANDYRIDLTSDRQMNENRQPGVLLRDGIPVLTIHAPGNVKDNSNQRLLRLEYGLPTANEIYGFTLEVRDVSGFDFYAEFDVNRKYTQYPNTNPDLLKAEKHLFFVDRSRAWMTNLSRVAYPWFAFVEAFSMYPEYNTSFYTSDPQGRIDYQDRLRSVYEFVDDNDDQDGLVDWSRRGEPADTEVFPGWDENNDFISDFNQNDVLQKRENAVPDYEEPFYRYGTDRPEFLFGIDMNNNGWVDRFENDEEPDFPYKRDHRGYNVYVGTHVVPGVRLTVGQDREWLLSNNRRALSTYLLFSLDRDYARLGRLRVFENVKKVNDNIPDNLIQWIQLPASRGQLLQVQDPLTAQNTWVNTTYVGFDYNRISNLNVINKLKYETYRQRDREETIQARGARAKATFFGMINRADYTLRWSGIRVQPRWKSEFRWETPYLKENAERKELTEIVSAIVQLPILRTSVVEGGYEFVHFAQLRDTGDPDFNQHVYALQLTNRYDYLGYKVTALVGISFSRTKRETDIEATTEGTTFLTIFAGAER